MTSISIGGDSNDTKVVLGSENANITANGPVSNNVLETKITENKKNIENALDVANGDFTHWDSSSMSWITTKTPTVYNTDTDVLLKNMLGLTHKTTVDKTPNSMTYPATQTDYLNYYYWNFYDPSAGQLGWDLKSLENDIKNKFPFQGPENSKIKYGVFNYSIETDSSGIMVFSISLIYVSRIPLVGFSEFVDASLNTVLGPPLFKIDNKTDTILGTTQGPRGGSANFTNVDYSEFNEPGGSFLMVPRIFQWIFPITDDKELLKQAISQHVMWANLSHNWYNQTQYKENGLSVNPTNIIDFFDAVTEITIGTTDYLFFSLVELYTGSQGIKGHLTSAYEGLNGLMKSWEFDRSTVIPATLNFNIPKIFGIAFGLNFNEFYHIAQPFTTGIGSCIINQEIIQQHSYTVTDLFITDWSNFYTNVVDVYYNAPVGTIVPPSTQLPNVPINNSILFYLSAFDTSQLTTTTEIYKIIGPVNLTYANLLSNGYIIATP